MILIICLVLVLLLFIISLVVAWDKIIVGHVPFISLPSEIIEQVLAHVSIKPGQTVYDLGCGDARVLVTAAQRQPQATYIGIERAFWPYVLAKYKTRHFSQITIQRGDITKVNLKKSAIVICYLLPELLAKIPFTNQEVVSVEYKIPNTTPQKEIILKKHSRLVSKMFFYTFT